MIPIPMYSRQVKSRQCTPLKWRCSIRTNKKISGKNEPGNGLIFVTYLSLKSIKSRLQILKDSRFLVFIQCSKLLYIVFYAVSFSII